MHSRLKIIQLLTFPTCICCDFAACFWHPCHYQFLKWQRVPFLCEHNTFANNHSVFIVLIHWYSNTTCSPTFHVLWYASPPPPPPPPPPPSLVVAYMPTWIGSTLVQIMTCRHYLNRWWSIVNWTLRIKLRWNLSQNIKFFFHENAFENIACEMAAIVSRGVGGCGGVGRALVVVVVVVVVVVGGGGGGGRDKVDRMHVIQWHYTTLCLVRTCHNFHQYHTKQLIGSILALLSSTYIIVPTSSARIEMVNHFFYQTDVTLCASTLRPDQYGWYFTDYILHFLFRKNHFNFEKKSS